jgi:murein DD-endopeptidase MepM/ murein hydrolase activator NlpD
VAKEADGLVQNNSGLNCPHFVLRPFYAPFYVMTIQYVRTVKTVTRQVKKAVKRWLYWFFALPVNLLRTKHVRQGLGHLAIRTALIGFVASVVAFFALHTTAHAVTYQGKVIGYVKTEQTLQDGIQNAKHIMQFFDLQDTPTLSFAIAPVGHIYEAEEIGNAIVNCHSDALLKASGLYIDKQYIGAVEDGTALRELLETLRVAEDTGKEVKPSAFVQDVTVTDGAYPKDSIISPAQLEQTLKSSKTNPVYYTVKSGDNLTRIARQNGLTLAQLRELNPAFSASDVLHIDDKLLIKQSSALLQVRTYRKETYTQTIPFETKVFFDRNHFSDEQRLVKRGINGKETVTAEIEYTDGVETGRKIISSTVIQKPVTQKIQVGTLNGSRPQGNGIATGKFVWPLPGITTITSHFGPRWGTVHQGLDISGYNAYGKRIVAADGGVVYAVNATNSWGTGMFAGYGYALIIDHGNGYRTLYAHCSQVIVKPGQRVSKGQTIAYVGNTGNSTGPHLHFEVRRNNKRVNPLPYLR